MSDIRDLEPHIHIKMEQLIQLDKMIFDTVIDTTYNGLRLSTVDGKLIT